MGVVLAAIPLLTACLATVLFKEKQNTLFWFSIVLGTGFLMLFFYQAQGLGVSWTVFIMLLAAALGYSLGGFVAKSLGGFQTICWMCILYLPFSLFAWGHEAASNVHTFNNWPLYWDSVLALLYVAILSQWLGFYFWYGAMANIGIAKAGQVQLLQPFFTLFFSVLLLGAALEAIHLAYAGLISLSVILCMKSR